MQRIHFPGLIATIAAAFLGVAIALRSVAIYEAKQLPDDRPMITNFDAHR